MYRIANHNSAGSSLATEQWKSPVNESSLQLNGVTSISCILAIGIHKEAVYAFWNQMSMWSHDFLIP